MKRKRFMQCNLLSINIFLEDFSNDNVVVHVRFELTIFVTTISRRFLPLKGIIMRTAKKATIVAPCNVQVLASGSATVPSANVWGYRYWES